MQRILFQYVDRTGADAELPAFRDGVEIQVNLIALNAASDILRCAVTIDVTPVVRDDVHSCSERDHTGIHCDGADARDRAGVSMADISLAGIRGSGTTEHFGITYCATARSGKNTA